MVSAVKWVDEIITDVPYNLTEDFLMELFRRHRIDYVVHGDDPCLLPDGTDAYAVAKRMGRFKMIRRTEGVSSTDIVGRMLLCSRDLSPSMSRGGAGEALAPHFADGDLPDSSGDSESDDTDGKQDRREPARGRRSNGAADAARARGERTASTLSNEGSRGGSPAAAHRRASEDSWVPDRSPPR